jgi:hypothetical protein
VGQADEKMKVLPFTHRELRIGLGPGFGAKLSDRLDKFLAEYGLRLMTREEEQSLSKSVRVELSIVDESHVKKT